MEEFSFERLQVYQQARILVSNIYRLLKKFPQEENYALCDQMRRSSISVTSNIAEGMARSSLKEQIHFIEYSYGSLMELYSQLEVAIDLCYISPEEFEQSKQTISYIAKMLSKLRTIRLEKLKSENDE